ncbi:MAG: DUF192 domain-containing protein [Candidatus Methylomirabilales bacterium]
MIARRLLPWVLVFLLVPVAGVAEAGQVRIGDRVVVTVEVAHTEAEKVRGLSGRDGLEPGRGMLFVYEAPARPLMWMQGMRFPLDILWIRDGRVVGLVKEAKPPAPGEVPEVFVPSQKVQYVLEVPAGFAERYGVVPDDPVEITLGRDGTQ